MSSFLVAVVGRPNVGKSTLINRLAARRDAIVHAQPGVTRDRNYVPLEWAGRTLTLIDTGGFQAEDEIMSTEIRRQALAAVGEADVILFLADRTQGVMPDDEEIASVLRAARKPVILAVNKVDDLGKHEADIYPFYSLGLGDPRAISAEHGLSTGDLLDDIVEQLPPETEAAEEEAEALSVAIVGRPNVGKSSLLNQLLGEERSIVTEMAGTTRDAVDSFLERDGERYRFIDTAGIRRKARMDSVEYYGFVRAMRALDRAEVALLLIDASAGVTEGDQKIATLAAERGCGLAVIANKWDLLKGDPIKIDLLEETYARRFRFITYAPRLKISAQSGYNVKKIFPLLQVVEDQYRRRITTGRLNVFVERLKAEMDMPGRQGKRLKIQYATQASTAPPRFVFFVNDARLATVTFRRGLERKIREAFGFTGVPIFLSFRSSK